MLKELIIAFQSFAQAHRFIREHKLWRWILIPGIIYAALFVLGFYFFWTTYNEAVEFMLQKTGIQAWLEKMQDGFLHYLFIMGHIILMMIVFLFYFSLFKYLFLILGAPLLSFLSEKTESCLEGSELSFSFRQWAADSLRGVRIALRNLLWQTVYLLSIMILSLVPVLGWVAPLFTLIIESYYLGFSMLDYCAARNQLNDQESIRFIARHKGLAIGNGIVFYAFHLLLPILGWVLAPGYSIVAATLSFSNARKHNIFA